VSEERRVGLETHELEGFFISRRGGIGRSGIKIARRVPLRGLIPKAFKRGER